MREDLNFLCRVIPTRRVGSAGNRQATEFVTEKLASFGFSVECPHFECIDWEQEGASLRTGTTIFPVLVSPYSLGCSLRASLTAAASLEELQSVKAAGKILLLYGELAKEQLMPKNFPFYNPEEHQQIVHALEHAAPAAILAATAHNPELAGGVYPFPLIEDGDFDVPSGYMTEEQGLVLLPYRDQVLDLEIKASRTPSTGCNVIARKGGGTKRLVLSAHIDAKDGTPGALDNASGVVVLLKLAELLQAYDGDLLVELLMVNGEDYYAASGEIQYVTMNANKFSEILININLDGAGYYKGATAFSFYECPSEIVETARKVFTTQKGFIEGEPWYQSDHMVFVQSGCPAIALTTEHFVEIASHITHTPKDDPRLVDLDKLETIAQALHDLVLELASANYWK